MPQYTCVIAYVANPDEETTVIVEAVDKAQALVVNCNLRPKTYVKTIDEIVTTGS